MKLFSLIALCLMLGACSSFPQPTHSGGFVFDSAGNHVRAGDTVVTARNWNNPPYLADSGGDSGPAGDSE